MALLFPAYAGVIPVLSALPATTPTFPRPRGGDPYYYCCLMASMAFSPPMRGFHIDNPA